MSDLIFTLIETLDTETWYLGESVKTSINPRPIVIRDFSNSTMTANNSKKGDLR